MTIRQLTLQDFEGVNDLFMQLHSVHVKNRPDIYRQIEKPTTPKAWDFEPSLSDPNKIMLGAEIDGNLVGFAVFVLRCPANSALVPRKFVYLDDIAVDENHRQKGIGKALYLEGIKRAKERGATAVELKVWSFNKSAIDFYRSLGMTVQNFCLEQKL